MAGGWIKYGNGKNCASVMATENIRIILTVIIKMKKRIFNHAI